jgi:hypothetical protein
MLFAALHRAAWAAKGRFARYERTGKRAPKLLLKPPPLPL